MALTDNLTLGWECNENTGTSVADASGNSRTGTLSNSPTWVTGKLGSGLTFASASSQSVSAAGGYKGVTGTSARSCAIWFKTTDVRAVNNNYLFTFGGSGTATTWWWAVESGAIAGRFSGGVTAIGGSGYNDGNWHLLVVTCPTSGTCSQVKAYVDGSQISLTPTSGSTTLNIGTTDNVTIGKSSTPGFFAGTLDEFFLWSRELTSGEVTSLWNGGSGFAYPWPSPSVTVTDQTSSRVYQQAAGTSAKTIAFAGTYANHTPATVEVKIVRDGTSTIVQDWTALSSPSISAGNWSGNVSVPKDNYWNNILVRTKDGGGTVQATSSQTSNKWGVGILVAMLGQSNMLKMWTTSSSPPTVNALTRSFSGSWAAVAGNGAIRFADQLQQEAGCPIGLLEYAVDGSGLVYDDGFGIWDSLTAGQPYPLFATGLTAAGGDCEFVYWHQGEADAKGATAGSTYKASLDTVYGRIRTATGRSTSQLKWLSHITGTFSAVAATDASTDAIRQAQAEWLAATTGAYWAGSTVDIALIDQAHHAASGYERQGRRAAQAIAKLLGTETYGADGPRISSVTVSGSDVTVHVTQDGGSGITELDGTTDGGSVTGFEVSTNNFSSTLTISSTAFTGGNVVLTLSAPPSGTVKVRYQYGKTPSITNPVYDNTTPQGDSIGLPLQPTVGSVTATSSGVRRRRLLAA